MRRLNLLRFAFLCALLLPLAAAARKPPLFESHSAKPGGGKTDISIREIERRPRASLLSMEIRDVGSSVGASFFLVCSIRKLAKDRGGFHHVVKLEDLPVRNQMLIGFLNSATEPPANTDPAFAGAGDKAQVIALDQFGAICDKMM